jgi:hypothetical protein
MKLAACWCGRWVHIIQLPALNLQSLAKSREPAAGSCPSSLFHAFYKEDLFVIVDLAKLHFNDLPATGGNVLADVGGFNG